MLTNIPWKAKSRRRVVKTNTKNHVAGSSETSSTPFETTSDAKTWYETMSSPETTEIQTTETTYYTTETDNGTMSTPSSTDMGGRNVMILC